VSGQRSGSLIVSHEDLFSSTRNCFLVRDLQKYESLVFVFSSPCESA